MANFRILPSQIMCDCGEIIHLDKLACKNGHTPKNLTTIHNLYCPACSEEKVLRLEVSAQPPMPKHDKFCGICGYKFKT